MDWRGLFGMSFFIYLTFLTLTALAISFFFFSLNVLKRALSAPFREPEAEVTNGADSGISPPCSLYMPAHGKH